MKDEKKAARQELILRTVCSLEVVTTVYAASPQQHLGHSNARDACLSRVSQDCASAGVQRLVIDRNESYVKRDQAAILKGADRAGIKPIPFEFSHLRRHEEPMLWIPDVLGWCYARGGTWRQRAAGFVEVTRV